MLRTSLQRIALFASGVIGLAACSDPSSESLASVDQTVLNGALSGPEEDMVVEVIAKGDTVTHTCTGTLLAANLVITARHCVANFLDAPFTCTSDGELGAGSTGGKMGPLLDPSRITVRTGASKPTVTAATAMKVFASQATSICRNDIAVVVLDKLLSDMPIAPVRLGSGNEPGENLRVVGYGLDENRMVYTRHTRSDLVISKVGTSQFRTNGDAVPPRTFVTEGPALCIGDSGGPAFVLDSGAVTGVWSQVVGECDASTARNYFTEVAPFEDELIIPAFAEAGAQPWREGTTGPGDPGTTTGGSTTGGTSSSAGAPGDAGSGDTGGTGTGTGGENANGGSAGAGNETGGAIASGGTTSTGGARAKGGATSAEGGANASGGSDGGLRKKGGCTCSMPGSTAGNSSWTAAPLAALGLLLRRRRARAPRSV